MPSRRRRPVILLALALFALAFWVDTACAADDALPQQQQQHRAAHRGHLPKSRSELRRDQERREKRRREAEALQAQADERNKAAADERAKKWRNDRIKMRNQFLRKQRASEEQQRKKQEAADAAQSAAAASDGDALGDETKQPAAAALAKDKEDVNPSNQGGIVGGRLDCFGVPGGPAQFDACDVCGGDDSSCSDCAGVPHGDATEDCAGVCQGEDRSCMDCAGVMNGPSLYDECGKCGGDGQSCRDCFDVVNGTAELDVCEVCGGDGSTCSDCRGVANGPAQKDPCGVCQGDGTSCCSPARPEDEALRRAREEHIKTFPDGHIEIDAVLTLPAPRMENPNAKPTLCAGHGTCSYTHHFCVCDRGWTGPFCTVPQNLCLHHQEQAEDEDPCNGRGECDPATGMCQCTEPEAWVGPRCEFSRCNWRGAYDLEAGRCKCQHGYGGQFCERCAALKPRPGRSHVCMEIPDAWQPVPQDLWLDSSILLGEKHPKAPVFSLIDASDEKAESYVSGGSFINLAGSAKRRKHRDFIWPNSTHHRSGYYYDCGCRLAAPPSSAAATAAHETDEKKREDLTRAVRLYRPQFPGSPGFSRYFANQARKQRALAERAPATLPQCQALLQEVLDEFGFAIDAATAEVSELSAAIGDVSSTCASEATFGIAWFLIAMLVAIVVAMLVILCIWCTRRYVTIRGPFDEL